MAKLTTDENMTREQISQIIQGLYSQYQIRNFYVGEGSIAFALAEVLGVKVKKSRDFHGKNKQTCLKITKKGEVTAIIPADQPECSQNYTLAMALGFYVLHYIYPGKDRGNTAYTKSLILPDIAEGQATGSNEATAFRQANIFAQYVTMPSMLISMAVKRGDSISNVSTRFNVPELMAAIRLRDYRDDRKNIIK